MNDIHHSGGCLCGAVRFTVDGPFESFFLCHCSRCRKGSGSAHASNLFSNSASINWVSGEENVTTFSVPGARHTRNFCSVCGSGLPHKHPGGRLKVPAGSLDTPVTLRPEAHIFAGSRADWDHELEDVPAFDTRPA
jgi:hypothetical protein